MTHTHHDPHDHPTHNGGHSRGRPHEFTGNRHDPTQTKTLRDQYGAQLSKRYRYLKGLIWQGVGVDDRLGLRDRRGGQDPGGSRDPLAGQRTIGEQHAAERRARRARRQAHHDHDDEGGPDRPDREPVPDTQPLPPDIADKPFDFPSDEAKIMFFNQWVEQAQDDLIADSRTLPSDIWGSEYIAYAYEKGMENARGHLEAFRVEIPESDMHDAFNMPIHQNTLEGLYVRNYAGLRDISHRVGREISDVLTEGFLEGVNPRVMARRMNDRIDAIARPRANTLARTEIIRAHNEAALSRYESVMGSEATVTVVSEFTTAGDSRVCEICQGLEGRRFSLKEARNFIPGNTHPNCRCTWVPVTSANVSDNRPAVPGGSSTKEGFS